MLIANNATIVMIGNDDTDLVIAENSIYKPTYKFRDEVFTYFIFLCEPLYKMWAKDIDYNLSESL